MNPDVLSEVDCCRLCGFVFRDKRRKRNVVGEFAKMFEKVVGVEVLEGDKQAVCDTCRYRVEKSWKSGKSIQEQLLKRRHPISPLTSTKGDKDAETLIQRKKPGHRLTFQTSELLPIRPIQMQIVPETRLSEKKTNEVSCQTAKTVCHCRPRSPTGTCVKVLLLLATCTTTTTTANNNDDDDNNNISCLYY